MAYFQYGVIGADGKAIEGVTITSPNTDDEAAEVGGIVVNQYGIDPFEQTDKFDKKCDEIMPGYHFSQLRQRYAQQGAEGARYYPIQ